MSEPTEAPTPAPLPIREQILAAITGRVSGERNPAEWDYDKLPVTAVIESGDTIESADYDNVRMSLSVSIVRALPRNGIRESEWYTAGNVALAELIVDVWGDDGATFGGLVDFATLTEQAVRDPSPQSKGIEFGITLVLTYAFAHGNPYEKGE